MSNTTEPTRSDDYKEVVQMLLERMEAGAVTETSEGYMLSCPLPDHNDSTPSFAINETNGLWRCYGCKSRGNIYQLAAIVLGVDLKDAKQAIQKYETRTFITLEDRKQIKQEYLSESVLIPFTGRCPTYMTHDRKLPKSFLQRFEIGFDATSASVVFPIRAINGRLVGITRRTVQSNVFPKYKHTFGWHTQDHLYAAYYGLDAAEANRGTTVVFVEGHIDALNTWHLAETDTKLRKRLEKLPPFAACVAIMGSAFSERHAKIAMRHLNCKAAVLAFDNDKAGAAALFGTEQAKEKKKRYKTNGPVGAIEALSTAGCRMIYRMHYDEKDPGDLKSNSAITLEEMT